MHSFSKIAGIRVLAISLAMILTVFGTQSLKAKDNQHCNSCNTCKEKVHSCNTCQVQKVEPAPTCGGCTATCKEQKHARHEAEEDRARAEKAQKKAADKAASERAEADAAEQKGAQQAAKYESKANQHLADAGLLCPTTTESAKLEAPPIVREKPAEPVTPAPSAPVIQEEQTIITPAPTVTPEEPKPVQKALPKTASPLDLIGLIGLLSFSGGVSRKLFRR
jgi:hypothetical protein